VSRSVPPLNPLHVFVTAAKAGNFTAAADALCVTASAVSRQISVLEGYLDVRLFHRGFNSNTLTDIGRSYFDKVSPAFDLITTATQDIRDIRVSTPLRIRVLSTFGMHFLIPRLPEFRDQHPSIHLSIDTGFAPADFSRADVDISIQLGSGSWPGTEAHLLFESFMQPVCGGRLTGAAKLATKVDDLRTIPLLFSRNRTEDWPLWLKAKGRPDFSLAACEMIEFSNSILMYQAAADGVGVALGQFPILSQDVDTGKLTTLLGPAIPFGTYSAVWRAGTEPQRKLRQFLAWLEREVHSAYGPHLAGLSAAAPR
jgi:LysR family glycine cleavage system transcriptional activator